VLTSSTAQWGWLVAHISLILAGYAALVLSFSASLLYLFQERALKAKHVSGLFTRLPPLQVTDEIGFRSLLIGFPFMTAGLVAGMVIAQAHFGRVDFRDAKILLSLLMWAVYLAAGIGGPRCIFAAHSGNHELSAHRKKRPRLSRPVPKTRPRAGRSDHL
jgi:ABC-type uncharacterized transport system permease subunit